MGKQHRGAVRRFVVAVLALVALGLAGATAGSGSVGNAEMTRYNVVLAGTETVDGFELAGSREAVLGLVALAGGTVALDLSKQIGVISVDSPNALFADLLRASPLVLEVGEDYSWKAYMSREELAATGATPLSHPGDGGGGPEPSMDPMESQQWSMQNIQTEAAHAEQSGWRAVDVGILDTGIDGFHQDFDDNGPLPGGTSNVDCARGMDFVQAGPGIGTPINCMDNNFHGTHVAGIVAAQANNYGVVGVAPNVTLIPVKVCDVLGFCYASASAAAITYAGIQKFDVINMSYFVDDDQILGSTELKCMDSEPQRTLRRMNERAIQFARNQGVVPVAALGNSDQDLSDPVGVDPTTGKPYTNRCEVVPAESSGVIGTMALGRNNQKAGYSSYGNGPTDVAAPGGAGNNGDCTRTVLSTFPNNTWFCIQGTSMASPHSAGVAALIVSEYGDLVPDTNDPSTPLDDTAPPFDVKLSPTTVEAYLQGTVIDQGLKGYDECFGHGRINALRAVNHDTSNVYDPAAPFCPEYAQ
jgi:subtilisin family serine protease